MTYQGGPGLLPVDDAEDTVGGPGLPQGADHDVVAELRRRRVGGMCFHHHRAARGERRGGVPTGHGEGEREVAGAEDRDRAEGHEHTPQVGAGPHGGVRCVVDRGFQVGAFFEGGGELLELEAGAGEFTIEAGFAQRGLPVGDRDDGRALRLQGLGYSAQQRGPLGAGPGG